ncbi:MAG: molybdenum cofactor biosynthesis protein, partial [Oscillospiraceae bacterium]|nr:molybdenum cofactor biosynthesis protein [Oscillospiraceae bacterium]
KKAEGKVTVEYGAFGENILTEGIDYSKCPVGTRLRIGEALLEITQIGKKCHTNCMIRDITGDCIMPREGIFAKVLETGIVRVGDSAVIYETRPFTAAVITASDRAYHGGYEDRSGAVIEEKLRARGFEVVKRTLLSDDEEAIYRELTYISDNMHPDVIFTTGGTGFSMRDRVPEATMRAAERNAPGIAEVIRAESMKITKTAALSRAVSVIRGRTLIINLPGSPKAVAECIDIIQDIMTHGIELLRGEADR